MATTSTAEETMSALAFTAPGRVEHIEAPVPHPGPGECQVAIAYVGICGTDLALFTGESPYLTQGLTTYPVRFGHEWSGVVTQVGEGVRSLEVGDRVTGHNFGVCGRCKQCRENRRWLCTERTEAGVRGSTPGTAAPWAVLPATGVVGVPDDLPLRLAACVEPLTCSRGAVQRCAVSEDDRVAVIGTGMLGLGAIQLLRARGASVDALGIDPDGLQLAVDCGAQQTFAPSDAPSDAYDVIIEASGAAAAIREIPRIAALAGRVGLLGLAHHDVDAMPMAQMVMKTLTLHGSNGGLDQWDQVLGLATRGQLDLELLIEDTIDQRDASRALERLQVGRRRRPKLLLAFNTDLEG